MGLDFINPKYLQKNSDAPSFLKPKQKYQTQEEIDKVQPVIDISKLAVHAATPSDNVKEATLPQPILPKVVPNTNIDYESIYKQHADPLDKAIDFVASKLGANKWLNNMHTNIAKDILTEQQKKQEAQNLAKSKTSNDAGLAPLNWLYNTPIGSRAGSSMGGVNSDGSPIVPIGDAGKIGNFVGNAAGSILNMKAMDGGGNAISSGFGTAEKAIDNLILKNSGKGLESASKLAQYATKAGSNAGEMGYFGGIQGGLEGDAKQGALNGALTGALFGVGSKALGDLIKLPGIVKDAKSSGINQAVESKLGNIDNFEIGKKGKITKIEPKPISVEPKPIDNLTPINEAAFTNTDLLKTKTDPIKLSTVTQDVSNNKGSINRKFAENSILNSEVAPSELKDYIKNNMPTYERLTDKQTWDKALNRVETDYKKSYDDFITKTEVTTAHDTALGEALILDAIKKGDTNEANRLSVNLAEKLTQAGQAVQAAAIFKRLSPEGMLMYANNTVNKVNQQLEKQLGKNAKKVQLTDEEANSILEGMKKVQELPDGREKDIEFAKVKQVIANKIPPKTSEKVKALQRIQMLLNPKTMLRNINGNVIMGGLENIKDIPTALTDMAVSLKTGERTTAFPSLKGLKTQAKGFYKGAKETIEDAKLGVSTSPSSGQFDLPDTPAFKNPILSKIEKATNVGLELGDRPFYQATYDESLRQQMKFAKTEKPTTEMIEKAKAIAEDRTFQNVSKMVEGFQGLQKGLNKIGSGFGIGNENFGIGNVAIPFAKTPANILDKATDYSPIGTVKAISQLLSKKEFDQKKFVDRIGRSITGSAAILLGYDLAKSGLMTGSANKDKDVAALEKQAGKSPYAIKIGDTYRTFDWAQPAAIPLAIGADIFSQGKDRKQATNVAVDAIKSGGQTLFQQSLLQGMQKLFGGTDPVSGFTSTLQGVPTQFLPGSLSKAVAQLKDPYVRDTYDPNAGKQILNQIQAKIPGLSEKLPAKLDTLGRPVQQYQGKNNLYNVLANPGYTTQYKPTDAEKIALDIYNKTGDKTIFPRVADNKITYTDKQGNSQTVQLTQSEKQALQQYIGQQTEQYYNDMAHTGSFTKLSDEDKVKLLQKRLTEIYNDGKNKILEGRGANVKTKR